MEIKLALENIDDIVYFYVAKCVKVVDGDTIDIIWDLGAGIQLKGSAARLRLYGINTPEIRGDEREKGLVSKQFVKDYIEGKHIIIRTHKDRTGKYGRYLAEVFYEDETGMFHSLNDLLIQQGLAEKY